MRVETSCFLQDNDLAYGIALIYIQMPHRVFKEAFILLSHNRMRVQWHVIPQHELNFSLNGCLKLIYPLP